MTSTLTAATLTSKIVETISLNGTDQGATNTVEISSIAEVDKRIVNVPTTEVTLVLFDTAAASGQYIKGDVRYVRLTNKDDTNFVLINIEAAGTTDIVLRLDPGASFLAVSSTSTGVVDYAADDTYSVEDLSGIKADADTAACDVEIFVASV